MNQQQHESQQEPSGSNNTKNSSETAADFNFLIQNDDDPYAILNVSQNANLEEIQKSYKLLSRSFHPDKQPPGPQREAAQKYFIQLKGSYDILVDPVLKLAYDDHGKDGVLFLKKATSLYQEIQDLIQSHSYLSSSSSLTAKEDKVLWLQIRQLLTESIQYYYFHTMGTKYQGTQQQKTCDTTNIKLTQMQKPETSAEIKIKCSTTHSTFLGEGGSDISSHPIEVESVHMSVNLLNPSQSSSSSSSSNGNHGNGTGIIHHKSLTFGAHTGLVANGHGNYYGGQISMQCEPIQNTDMTVDVQFGPSMEDVKLTMGTTRIMSSSRTFVSSTWSTPLFSPSPLSSSKQSASVLTFTTHRSLFQDTYHGLFLMGVTQKFQFLYGLLQCSTNHPDQKTKYTAKLNTGMNYTPLQFIAEHTFQDEHKGKFTIGFGTRGFDLQAILSRYISKYCKLSLGVHHVSSTGLTWLFQLQRDTLQFTVPIFISSSLSPAYAVKTMYSGLFLGLLDASIGDYLNTDNILYELRQRRNKNEKQDETTSEALKREDMLLDREKMKREAIQQMKLMKGPADMKRKTEEDKNGLVILNAIYSISDGDSINVIDCLMFWVVHSSLRLPSMPKSNMLGFYDVRQQSKSVLENDDFHFSFSPTMVFLRNLWKRFNLWEKAHDGINKKYAESSTTTPTLYVRYRFGGSLFEITINDEDMLTLPSKNATRLGGSNVK
jgi:hypothetical protein